VPLLVRTELADDVPQIVGDRVQLQQVAMNLIVNSIEAMKDVDGIREMVIKSRRAESDQILVSVSDTGIGFSPQLAEQIFDPFFTTKPNGTGMGLRISRSIIESHGGSLWAVGAPGAGRDFSREPARRESRPWINAGHENIAYCISPTENPRPLHQEIIGSSIRLIVDSLGLSWKKIGACGPNLAKYCIRGSGFQLQSIVWYPAQTRRNSTGLTLRYHRVMDKRFSIWP
jgi:hypothetical protein